MFARPLAAGAEKTVVTTSPQGYTKRISIDWDTSAIDDEVCYTISDVVPESGSVRPWPKPRPIVDWTAKHEVRLTTWGSSSWPWKLDSVQARGTQSAILRLDGPDASAARRVVHLPWVMSRRGVGCQGESAAHL